MPKLAINKNEVPLCFRCGKPASCFGSPTEYSKTYLCDKCCDHSNNVRRCRPIEIYFCHRTKNCGWRGAHDDLRSIRDSSPGFDIFKMVCPRCGNNAFWVKKLADLTIDAYANYHVT